MVSVKKQVMSDMSDEAWTQVHYHISGTLSTVLWKLLSHEVNKVVHDHVWHRITFHLRWSR